MAANIHIKTGGTRVSGESTADDWSDANCYPTLNDSSGAWSGATTIYLDNQATVLEAGAVGTADFANATTVTFNARDDSARATLSINSATAELFNTAPASAAITFNDIFFTRAVTMTSGATIGLLYFAGTTLLTLNFNRCHFGGFGVNAWDPVSKHGLLFTSLSTVSRTTTFTDCVFRDITDTVAGHYSMIRCGGSNQTFSFVRCTWQDCAFIASEDTTVGIGLYGENNAIINLTNCAATDISYTAAATTTMCRPFYYTGVSTPTVNVAGFTFTNMTWGASDATVEGNGWGISVKGPHSITGVHSTNCVYHNSTGFDGGQLYIDGPAAIQSEITSDISAVSCQSRSGASLFVSNGASGIYERIYAYDCDTDAGVIYCGGYGDFTLRSSLVDACRSSAGNDGQIFVRNNTEQRNKTATISNVTVVNCTTGGSCAGIKIENATTGYTMTATINNAISRNTNTNDIEASDSVVTTNNCAIKNATSGTTNQGLTTDDPKFENSSLRNWKLAANSPLASRGKFVGAFGDFSGAKFHNPPSIGAYQSTHGGAPARNNKRLILRNYMPIEQQGYHEEDVEKVKRLKIEKRKPLVRVISKKPVIKIGR